MLLFNSITRGRWMMMNGMKLVLQLSLSNLNVFFSKALVSGTCLHGCRSFRIQESLMLYLKNSFLPSFLKFALFVSGRSTAKKLSHKNNKVSFCHHEIKSSVCKFTMSTVFVLRY